MWIVVDIGCIECGESSSIVGVFSSKERADTIVKTLLRKRGFIGGQHDYEAFELPVANVVAEDYREYLTVIDGEATSLTTPIMIEGKIE